jgi:PAS domain-containing protein
VDTLPEEKTEAAKRFLELLLGDGAVFLPEKPAKRLNLLERIVDSLPDATLAVDREGKVLVWNRAMEEMTGVKREEMLGRGEYAYAVPFYGKKDRSSSTSCSVTARNGNASTRKSRGRVPFSSAKVLPPLPAAAGGFTSGPSRPRSLTTRETFLERFSASATSASARRWRTS